jgi:3-hydroxybutyryl-CoA dehydratase
MNGGEEAKALHFDEICVGHAESFFVTVTGAMMEAFGAISGDINPLHVDVEYAKSVGHPRQVVYGILTASFYSRLAGMYIPGKYCLLQRVDLSFTHPVYIDDVLKIEGEVSKVHESVRRIEIKARASNQSMREVSRATIWAGLYA